MYDIKVTDCGRDVLQKILSDHINQGYEIVSVMCIERYKSAADGNMHTLFTVVFKK